MGTRTWGQTIYSSNGLAASGFTYDPATLALDKETITYTLPNQPAFTRILDRSQDSLARTTGYTLGTPTSPSAFETQATYGYSATTGRLETVSNGTSTFRYDYLANSSLIEHVVATAGAVHDVHLTYEPTRDVLATRQNKVGTNVISQYDYTVNSIGQRSAVAQVGTAFQAVRAIAWQYDSLGQVIQADSNENTHDRAYQFDAIGNREKTANGLLGDLPTNPNWAGNPLNQLTKVNGEDLPADSYDSDGNQINAKVLPLGSSSLASCVYSWDAENRLISATVNGTTTTYLYDAQSRRIATTSGGETTVYVYDGWNCIAEYGSAGVSPASYSLTKTRLWGTDLSGSLQGAGGVGGLLSVTSHSALLTSHFPTFDGNGNVSEYLAADGAVAAHFEYDPFGNTVVNTDTTNQFAYRFSTKPQDLTTGLLYYGYRYLDPLTGRWPSRDPIEEEGGMNFYAFVENDGISNWEYLGMWFADGSPRTDKVHGIVLDGAGVLKFDPSGGYDKIDEIHEKAHIAQISGGDDPREDKNPAITIGPVAEWPAVPYKQLFWCCAEDDKGNPIRDDKGNIKFEGWCYFKNHGTWQNPQMKKHFFKKSGEKELWESGVQVIPFDTHQAADSEIPMYEWTLKHTKNKNKRRKIEELLAQHRINKGGKAVEYQSWTAFKKAHADEKSRYLTIGLTWKWKDESKVYSDIK